MTTISLLGLALLLILLLIVLALALELLYVLCYRRRFQRATSVHDSQLHVNGQLGARVFSKELILYLLFYNHNQPSEDPASVVPTKVDRSKPPVADVMEKEKAAADPCEVSHMIGVNEESKRSVLSRSFERKVREHVAAAATPFETPCASPQYYTPAASPVREAVEVDWRGAALADELA